MGTTRGISVMAELGRAEEQTTKVTLTLTLTLTLTRIAEWGFNFQGEELLGA